MVDGCQFLSDPSIKIGTTVLINMESRPISTTMKNDGGAFYLDKIALGVCAQYKLLPPNGPIEDLFADAALVVDTSHLYTNKTRSHDCTEGYDSIGDFADKVIKALSKNTKVDLVPFKEGIIANCLVTPYIYGHVAGSLSHGRRTMIRHGR